MTFSFMGNRSFARVLNITLPIATLIALLILRLIDPGSFFERVKLSVFDGHVSSDITRPSVNNPAIPKSYLVAIDDASLEKYGQWPWSRETISEILISLYEKGVSLVAIDLIFAEPDRLSPDAFLKAYDISEEDIKRFSNAYGYTNTDKFFADVLSQTPTVLALTGADTFDDAQKSGYSYAMINAELKHLPSVMGMHMPSPIIREGGAYLGHGIIFNDVDGTLRKLPALVNSGGDTYPALFISVLASLQNTNTVLVKGDKEHPWELNSIKVGRSIIPVLEDASFVLKPKYIPERYESLPLNDVLTGLYDKKINESIVILGPTAAGLAAQHDIAGKLSLPGSYLHVGALEQIRASDFLFRPVSFEYLELALGILVGLLTIYFVMAFSGVISFFIVFAVTGLLVLSSRWVYQEHALLTDWSFVLISLVVAFLVTQIIRVLRHENEKGEIRKAFSTYLNPQLVNELANHPERLKLGGERKDVTLLFADIRGFTSLSESYADRPEELTSILNKLLTPLTDCIIQNEGTIDKYMGDAIMAFWNAPLDIDEPNEKAVKAALEMLEALKNLNDQLMHEGLINKPLELGVGLNSGTVIVGNLGSDQRFDYSCIGDAVNLASRIEGLTKQYSVPLLLGESVVSNDSLIKDVVPVLVDTVNVVGKQKPENIFSMYVQDEWIGLHDQLWRYINSADWDSAENTLKVLAEDSNYPEALMDVVSRRVSSRDEKAYSAKAK